MAVSGSGDSRRGSWAAPVGETHVMREGIVAGLIGAVVLAAWFFVLDLLSGRLLFTPAALGSALFEGAGQPGAVEYTMGTVLGYTIIHVVAFLLAGLAVAAIVAQSENHPSLLLALVLLFVTFETLVMGLLAIIGSWLLEQLTWWAIGMGNLLAAAAMAAYLWKRHPRLTQKFQRAEQSAAAGSRGVDDAADADAGRGFSRRPPAAP